MRIMRVFKLVRHFAGLQSLAYTLQQVTLSQDQNIISILDVQAYKELGLMMVLVGVAVLTFASLVFFVERDSQFVDGKWTFLDSVWWGILTVTTVGHHVK